MLDKFTKTSILEDSILVEEFQKNALNYFVKRVMEEDLYSELDEQKMYLQNAIDSDNSIQCIYTQDNVDYIIFFNSLEQEEQYVYNSETKYISEHDTWDFAFYIEDLFKGVSIKYISEYLVYYLNDNKYMSEELKRIEFQKDSFRMFNE